jgi:hypothetical protein
MAPGCDMLRILLRVFPVFGHKFHGPLAADQASIFTMGADLTTLSERIDRRTGGLCRFVERES